MRFVFFCIIVFFSKNLYAASDSKLHIAISTGDVLANVQGQYFSSLSKKIKKRDRFILVSATDGNIVMDYDIKNLRIRSAIKEKKINLASRLDRKQDQIVANSNTLSLSSLALHSENREIRLDYVINSLINIVEIYQHKYKEIEIYFLGDSYLMHSSEYSFIKNLPSAAFLKGFSDGDLSLVNNPFYFLEPITIKKESTIKINVLYDIEHPLSSKYGFFFNKLMNKYFGSEISSYSNQVDDTSKVNFESMLGLYPKQLVLIKDSIETPCDTDDEIYTSFDEESFKLTVKIINICRANRIASLKFMNENHKNPKNKKIHFDNNGEGKTWFNLKIGKNHIEYFNLVNSSPQIIFEKKISVKEDNIEIIKRSGHDEVEIAGRNLLREDGSIVKIKSLKTGIVKETSINNGLFSVVFPIGFGQHKFEIEQIDGSKIIKAYNRINECFDHFEYDKEHLKLTGNLKGKVFNKCRRPGSFFETIYYSGPKDISPKYNFLVNEKNEASIYIPFFRKVNEVFYLDKNGNKKILGEYLIDDFSSLVKVSIFWSEPVFLNLHVFEPNYIIDKNVTVLKYGDNKEHGHVYFKNPTGLGSLEGNSPILEQIKGSVLPSSYSESYIAKLKKDKNTSISFYVDYPFRHTDYFVNENTKEIVIPKYCNKRAQGGLVFEYKILIDSTLETGEHFFPPANCILRNNSHTGKDEWVPSPEDTKFLLLKKHNF